MREMLETDSDDDGASVVSVWRGGADQAGDLGDVEVVESLEARWGCAEEPSEGGGEWWSVLRERC